MKTKTLADLSSQAGVEWWARLAGPLILLLVHKLLSCRSFSILMSFICNFKDSHEYVW